MERADAIDRERAEAEEGLRAAQAELGRERASLAAAARGAAEMQDALDRKGARLTQAEVEASKALSLQREVLSTMCRLDAVKTERADAVRAAREAQDSCQALAAALDELAELTTEVLSAAVASTTPGTIAATTDGASMADTTSRRDGASSDLARGGENEDIFGVGFGGNAAAIARLASLEAALRRKVVEKAAATGGTASPGSVAVDGAGAEAGRVRAPAARGERGLSSSVGQGELRRAVRAVRGLAEARVTAMVERDRSVAEVRSPETVVIDRYSAVVKHTLICSFFLLPQGLAVCSFKHFQVLYLVVSAGGRGGGGCGGLL